jgi:glycine/D-amino acid oxidase-like deaminating enzyme
MKAIICGAGITGLSAANFLSANEWDVTIVEWASGPRPEGYMIDFFGRGWQEFRERYRSLGSVHAGPHIAEQQKAGISAAKWFVPADRRSLRMRRLSMRLIKMPGVNRLVSGRRRR